MIYIIGDSHVSVFSGTDKGTNGLRHIQPEFGTCYTISGGSLRPHNVFEQRLPMFCPIKIGSNTAYNSFNKLPIIEQVLLEYNITQDDYVFMCFGEIDIRNHIGFNAEKLNISIFDGIIKCVDKYTETLIYLKDKKINLGVYGPPASSENWGHRFGIKEYGDIFIRNNMTLEFNELLKEKCIDKNVIFKEIATKMILPCGTTDGKYFMDELHLSQETMPLLMEEFKDIIK